MIDIDHFRRINNTHGHAVGDRVLKEIVNRATFALRPSDLVARMGGEEFVVVLPETDFDTALQIANAYAVASVTCRSREATARRRSLSRSA